MLCLNTNIYFKQAIDQMEWRGSVRNSCFESKNLVCCTNLHKSGLQK